jgi:tellurite resistance protein TehA-like permease
MGTGIVSIGLAVDGFETLSRVLLAVAAAVWAGLGFLLVGRAIGDRPRAELEAESPASLTGVAGTAVLGARCALLGWNFVAMAMLALAACLWLLLVPRVLRHWKTPTVGASFILTVGTESLAVLAAIVALRERVAWLAIGALCALALGVLAYVFVLARFDFRQLLVGHGDHWVAGGALAIATLACGKAEEAAAGLAALHGLAGPLGWAALVLWIGAVLWLPALVICELVAPRLHYDVRRWSTVFPVGMYAACSFEVGAVRSIDGLVDFARVWVWVAVVLWAVVFAALLRRGVVLWRTVPADHAPPTARAGAGRNA